MSSTSTFQYAPDGSGTSTTFVQWATDVPAPSSNGQQNASQNTTLYLYTFLATLIVLVGVSLCILARSLSLRARRRRILADILTRGEPLPPGWGADGRFYAFPRRAVPESRAPPPRMWDAAVPPVGAGEKYAFEDVCPLSASRSVSAAPSASMAALLHPPGYIPPPSQRRARTGRFARYFFPAPPVRADTGAAPGATTPTARPASTPTPAGAAPSGTPAPLTLTVLIAMPDATRGARKPGADDGPPPYCELGVSRMHFPGALPADATAVAT